MRNVCAAQAKIQAPRLTTLMAARWIPAFAGMTNGFPGTLRAMALRPCRT